MEMSVAPAAGASTLNSREYDVFINHRGPDVKKTFVAHLYAALSSWGIRPFLDAEDIQYAVPVFEEIDKALKGACVHVAIFSKGYAESKYCLEELCAMLKSEQRIIPVFYDVEAENLRRPEDGLYKEAFAKHRKRKRTEKIPIWKEALHKVADYRAFRMDEVNGNEHQLIRRILVEVRNALPLDLLPGRRIGLEKSMKDVVKTLESVSVIGLVGMGGIGKTTLAMEVYNHFLSCRRFERYCFLKDVRSSQTSILQNKVLRDLGVGFESHCDDVAEYTRTLRGALKDGRVLVIVDDISDANQFEALIPEINELMISGLECRIVITSRGRDVLKYTMKTVPADSQALYEVQILDESDSQRLFNIHAFMSETPSEGFVELAETISDACGGLPLSLTVMGSYLFDKEKPEDKEIWSESVKLLQENREINDKLRICYDGLPTNGDRAMFRDIACMLIGVKQEIAMTIWKSCSNCSCRCSKTPASSLRNLIDRSLVRLDKDDRLRMHDVLRDMGREIVETDDVKGRPRPPKKWTHLWDPGRAAEELSRGEVNTKTRGICLAVEDPDAHYNFQESTISCEASKLGRMQELHLLRLDGCNVVPDDFSSWSPKLRWLQWRLNRLISFPPLLKLSHLVVLDLSWSIELRFLWERNVHVMVNMAHLVVLDLSYCQNMTCLWENDANIQLPRLEVLKLKECKSLAGLPNNFGGSVPKLKRLEMNWCANLWMLPDSIGLLTKLEHLDVSNCGQLDTSPIAHVGLVGLKTLNLSGCSKLEEVAMGRSYAIRSMEYAATSKSVEYDVFINHRGRDVTKTFVAHLYDALSSSGFRPFLDPADIGYAEPIFFEGIDKALKGARVHVAIFSKRYAESIYCLGELCAMLESGRRIIPVFYDVDARHLRRPEVGPYREAFERHRRRGRTEKISIWKEALHKVVDYRGFRMDEVNGNEHELIRRIVVEVRSALPPDLLPGRRIGLEKSMKAVLETLQSVCVIGLLGMGGIGKTMLAMEVYNHFISCRRFERYCFLEDVRSSQTSVLQNKVLRDLGVGFEWHCDDVAEYTRRLNGALKDGRVLVIVDDISDSNQIKALFPEINAFGLECRIVITSRRLDVLKAAMKIAPADSQALYEVQILDESDSQRLFNIHAFMSETPSEGFVELAETISDACGGLPLSLTVMGSYLFDKEKPEDKEIWSESVKLLQENREINDKLRICYDGLPTNGDRAMFRDIACMLIGVKQEIAMTIWKSCSNCSCRCSKTPASSLRNLIDRSLVRLDKDDRLRMHDVLRDMGREIVETDDVKGRPRPPKKWTHLWDPGRAAEELSRGEVNTKTRGICLAVEDPDAHYNFQESTISCEASKLGRMQELHLLRLDGCNVVPDDFSSWSPKLRWLQWRLNRLISFPPLLKLSHLVVLDLSWSIELRFLWERNVHVMVNMAHLVVLDLSYCQNMTCLWENDANIQLPRLEVLKLKECKSLAGLPNNFGGSVPKLKRLDMCWCWNLKTLPDSIGLLTELSMVVW